MIDRFLDRVARGPLLLDAALGTRLIAQGLDLATDDPCLWNLTRPDAVLSLHRLDVLAGAAALFTNTFGANRAWLARFGRPGSVGAINRSAVELARAAAGPDRFVIGSVGPTATGDGPALLEQVDALLDAGVDALALETCRLDQALAALGHRLTERRSGPPIPILVGLFAWPEPDRATAERLLDAGATIVGANCFADLTLAHRLIDACTQADPIPFWLKPSTGWPDPTQFTLDDFADLAARLATMKTGLLGGCCGTSDVHLRAIRAAWEE